MKASQLLALALMVSGGSAFMAPLRSPRASRAVSAKADFSGEIGAPQGTPGVGAWDPLGLLDDADEARFNRLREVELKHGRISMLAVLGHIVTTSGARLPGYISPSSDLKFSDVPSGLAGLGSVPFVGIMQIIVFCGFLELFVMKDVIGNAEFIGDFRNGYIDFGWDKKFDPATKAKKREIEINNGRAAMMGILGLMVHEKLDNNPYMMNDWFGSHIDFNAGF